MDEIDAALDFKNVSIVANYIKERTKNAQFIIVSLRNYMFELADRLVGIYKTYNCTKSVAINPKSFIAPVHDEQTDVVAEKPATQTQPRSGFRPVSVAEATVEPEEENTRKSKSRTLSLTEEDLHNEEEDGMPPQPRKKQKTSKK